MVGLFFGNIALEMLRMKVPLRIAPIGLTDRCDVLSGALFAVHSLTFGSSAVCTVFYNATCPLLRRVAVITSWVYALSHSIPIQITVLSARLRAHHVRAVSGDIEGNFYLNMVADISTCLLVHVHTTNLEAIYNH